MKFHLSEIVHYLYKCKCTNFAWNIVVISGLVFLIWIWMCRISCWNKYKRLLVHGLTLLLNPCLIVEIFPVQFCFISITLEDVYQIMLELFRLFVLMGGGFVFLIFFSVHISISMISMRYQCQWLILLCNYTMKLWNVWMISFPAECFLFLYNFHENLITQKS